MLVTDFAAPGTFVLRRLTDARVRQYWDPHHLVAAQIARDARPPQPVQNCCERSGTLWDLAAVYRRGAVWTERMPPATVFDGPVLDVTDQISRSIR
ncbi:MAG: hypothetical protein V7647_2061 [Acidobacteriota bacterium]|jgi:hypothetical protein